MRVLSIGILFHRPQCERELLYEVEVSEKEVIGRRGYREKVKALRS